MVAWAHHPGEAGVAGEYPSQALARGPGLIGNNRASRLAVARGPPERGVDIWEAVHGNVQG